MVATPAPKKEWPKEPDAPVRLFKRDGEIYADCVPLDLLAQGDTEAEALENLSWLVRGYYAMRALGCERPGRNLRNELLRIAFPQFDRFTFMPVPSFTAAEAEKYLRDLGSDVDAILARVQERRRELLR